MIRAKVGFIVYGVHKDGLADPMGAPFIDDKLVANAKKALTGAGLEVIPRRKLKKTYLTAGQVL